jgi:polyisoprenoid-binding protein YceI
MLKRLLAATVVLSLATGVSAAEWKIDRSHSSVNFQVSHLVISKVNGNFQEFEGTITFDGENFREASTDWTVQTASISTDDEKRDNHLRSDDFFNAEKYPSLTFVSTEVIPGEGNQFKIVGDLTIRGITKQVTFDCVFRGTVQDPWGGTRAGFTANATIDRKDFDVKWNKVLDTGGLTVGDEVEITIEVEAIKS